MRITLKALLLMLLLTPSSFAAEETTPSLKALLVTGGCYHDYETQKQILTEGISARANVDWTVVHEGDCANGSGMDHRVSIFEQEGWAKGYDVVVHNACFADVDDAAFVERVARAHHDGVPAVVVHCAMHTFRAAPTEEWLKLVGVTSTRHENHRPEQVRNLQPDHPIMQGFPAEWETPNGELYIITDVSSGTTPLAQAFGPETQQNHPVIWTNQYGHTRVFGTTLGHHNETMDHPIYLDFISRGLLWACDKLADDGTPRPGYGPLPAGTPATP